MHTHKVIKNPQLCLDRNAYKGKGMLKVVTPDIGVYTGRARVHVVCGKKGAWDMMAAAYLSGKEKKGRV